MRILSSLATAIFLVSCSLVSTNSGPSQFSLWAAEATPANWELGTSWVLVLIDEDGRIESRRDIQFTDSPASTCSGGDWYRIDVLSPQSAFERRMSSPAYQLEGSALMIDLNARVCDANRELVGKLTSKGAAGSMRMTDPFGSEDAGSFIVVPR